MNIYFAGSIRGGREDKELYLQIIALLKAYGTVLTEHVGDQTLSVLGEDGPTEASIYERDMQWLKRADVVVAEVTTPSLGVGYEIATMEGKKPILCLYRTQEGKNLSAMIAGNPHLGIKEYCRVEDLEPVFNDFFASSLLPATSVYHKLVRDRIPEIILANGEIPIVSTLDDDSFATALNAKLIEEAHEVEGALTKEERLEECADLLEVIEAMVKHTGADMKTVVELQQHKREKRGGFTQRLFLEGVKEK